MAESPFKQILWWCYHTRPYWITHCSLACYAFNAIETETHKRRKKKIWIHWTDWCLINPIDNDDDIAEWLVTETNVNVDKKKVNFLPTTPLKISLFLLRLLLFSLLRYPTPLLIRCLCFHISICIHLVLRLYLDRIGYVYDFYVLLCVLCFHNFCFCFMDASTMV